MSFLFFYKIKNFVWPRFSGQLTWHVTRYLCRIESRKIRWQPKINGKIEKKKNQINIRIQKKRNKFEKKNQDHGWIQGWYWKQIKIW
jgi:hypothetical protein